MTRMPGASGAPEARAPEAPALFWSDALACQLLEAAPDAMIVADARGAIIYVNGETEKLFGYARTELIGQPIEALIPEGHRSAHIVTREAYVTAPKLRHMGAALNIEGRRRDGSLFPADVKLSPVLTPSGLLVAAAVRDITDRVNREAKLILQIDQIENQRAAIQELQVPTIEVGDGVLLLPIVGSLTSERAAELSQGILLDIARLRASRLVLDLGGVPVVDTAVATHLLRIVSAAALLGCKSVLTGIRPEVAQIIISLGIDLSGVEARRTLKDALVGGR